jgi:glucose dehydrogenase
MPRRFLAGAVLVASVIGAAYAQKKPAVGEWTSYGGGKGFNRYSPLDQINRDNVKNLQVVWYRPPVDAQLKDKYPDLSPSNYFRGTPVMVGGVLFAPNGVGLVEAFDAGTGKTKWVQQPVEPTLREASGDSTRGVAYWRKESEARIVSVRGEYLYAMDAKTGAPSHDFGENGRISLNRHTPDEARYFGFPGPFVVNDVIVVGGNGGGKSGEGYGDGGFESHARPEDIRGYDIHTGKLLWTFHNLPLKGEPGYDTWGKGSAEFVGNMAAWGSMTADEQLGYVYVPLSAPTVSYYGGHRPGKNLFSDSLVVLNAKTGKLVWYFQMVHHDLWDYDSATPPVLGDITVNGKRIKAVFASNKTGFLYVFDRVTGKPVWPIEERPVPQSNTPGEETWPTQPFPTKPPAFDRQGFTEADLIDFTPELRKKALDISRNYVMGPLFTPPSLMQGGKKGTLALPGAWGSGNWNTGAFDPETGIYYAVSMTQMFPYGLLKTTDPKATMTYYLPEGSEATAANLHQENSATIRNAEETRNGGMAITVDGLPITQPPYGRITALDLNKGAALWTVPNGDGPRNHPLLKDLNLPSLGNTGRPVALVTKTLLFLGDASASLFGQAGITGPAKFRAYDKATGQVIWEKELPAGTTGGPITYLSGSKQYILLPIGGASFGAGWVALAVAPESETITLNSQVPAPSAGDGLTPAIYTQAQAQHGATLFKAKCSACHGVNTFGPPLSGDTFWKSWNHKTARSLYSRIIGGMPPDDPGSIPEKDAIDLVAHLLQKNGLPAGVQPTEKADALNSVTLHQPK